MKKFLLLLFFLFPLAALAQSSWKKELLSYINTRLSKPDGGYGWEDQYDSHLTPTYAVTGILYDIDALPADKARLAEFIRTHHPQKSTTTGTLNYFIGNTPRGEAGPSGSNMRNLVYEQIQAVRWLGGDLHSFDDDVKSWKSQAGVLANYEGNGYAGLFQETMTPICNEFLGLTMTDGPGFLRYLESCRRSNGSFNNALAAAGGDGNVLNTCWALAAWDALGGPKQLTAETVSWLQKCQRPNGGFTHQPSPAIGVNDDVAYTWAAIKALARLNAAPADKAAAIRYLASLRNADGGFGARPGLHSTPVASFYAIDALTSLGALAELDRAPKPKSFNEPRPDFSGYKVYTVQFQAQGSGSPLEAVMLADSLNIHLWGVKYPVAGWTAEAQRIANERKVPVTFFQSDEPHDNEVSVEGMGSFNHVLDYIAPPNVPVHFSKKSSFAELKSTTLEQLRKANGGLMLQVSNNEPLARILIDESLNNFGYVALSTVHFGQNFMFWLPYLAEYRYRLPMVTLQDAHGAESWWWTDELTNHRTLFIAKEPTYDAMIAALKKNWVVGVRHDSVSNYKTRMLGGTDAARVFINTSEKTWKWWDGQTLSRPQAVITVISKEDKFEEGRPEAGLAIRVRTRWTGVRQALRAEAVRLIELMVDGKAVKTEQVVKKAQGTGGATADAYYLFKWGEPLPGQHKIEARVKDIRSGKEYRYVRMFSGK
ncbi:prenyltransferase/squalene oxidase repeat-containing protein [Hufsiella ginkgonis]|uniref:Geranylgeranyl transferase type II subunit beta n=1 Tax=Hufsiella ginkgonis TaxID=2695274 RepID=A0A7K1XS12_9SPHI|nr:prenyltransferase/squalene oxidase repeat-containing protein [Hufsiella ginkgonis]MXV13775.1 hypothetical protein [Hufsiella ginkgonis]